MSEDVIRDHLLRLSKEQLVEMVAKQEDTIYRQMKMIIRLHGGEVRSSWAGRGRGRPKGSSAVSAAKILSEHGRLHRPEGKHVTQPELAEAVHLEVSGLKYLLRLYGLGWPLD